MSVNLSPVGNGFQFFTNNGEPLVGGKLDTYQAGSTTPLTTFTDSSGLIPNTNPIILGTDGRPPDTIWLSEGFFYKFVLSDANDVQIQVYDNLYGIIGVSPPAATPIPSGAILLWSGSIGSIPAGYVLCNGNNSTPDLRDRFIVGAGSTYAVDATGGSADATLPTHTHTATSTSTSTDSGHTHPTVGGTGNASGGGGSFTAAFVDGITHTSTSGTSTANVTTTTTTTNANAGTSGTNANLPPYYALCYIMKT
jgi:hypothetical protein